MNDWAWIIDAASKNGSFAIGLVFGALMTAGYVMRQRHKEVLPAPSVTKSDFDQLQYQHGELERRHNVLRADHEKLEVKVAAAGRVIERLDERTKGL